MIDNIPQPDTYKKDYLEAASRVRVSSVNNDNIPTFKPIKKSISKEVSNHIKIDIPKVKIPSIKVNPTAR